MFQEYFYLAVGILSAVTIHECAHAYVADRLGDPTAKYEGRISLNPLAHLDFMGTVLFILIGFGWGKPVPVHASNFRDPWKASMLVAFAGPASNILLAILLSIVLRIFHESGISQGNYFFLLTMIAFQVNVALAVFNMLPFPPLDGSKVAQLLIPTRYKEYYYSFLAHGAQYFMYFMIFDLLIIKNFRGGQTIIGSLIGGVVAYVEYVLLLGS